MPRGRSSNLFTSLSRVAHGAQRLAPVESTTDDATFKIYQDHSHGKLNKSLYAQLNWPAAPVNEVGSLGEVATQDMLMIARTDVDDSIDLGADATTDEDSDDEDDA